jgi:hypothetical protein
VVPGQPVRSSEKWARETLILPFAVAFGPRRDQSMAYEWVRGWDSCLTDDGAWRRRNASRSGRPIMARNAAELFEPRQPRENPRQDSPRRVTDPPSGRSPLPVGRRFRRKDERSRSKTVRGPRDQTVGQSPGLGIYPAVADHSARRPCAVGPGRALSVLSRIRTSGRPN